MPNSPKEDPLVAIGIVIVLLFVVGGYLAAWWTIQKILFFQSMFWFNFYGAIILVLGAIFFFICFLIKESETNNWEFYGSELEFFDKKTIGFFSLGCLILALIFFAMMLGSYEKGFSTESIQKLAESEKKLAEFNYIKDVLTGVEIERLMTENFDLVMKEICNQNPTVDCNLLVQNYRDVRGIFEAKERADGLMSALRLIDKEKETN